MDNILATLQKWRMYNLFWKFMVNKVALMKWYLLIKTRSWWRFKCNNWIVHFFMLQCTPYFTLIFEIFPHENKQMSTIYDDFTNAKHGLVHHLKYDLALKCLLIYDFKVKFEHFMHVVSLIMHNHFPFFITLHTLN